MTKLVKTFWNDMKEQIVKELIILYVVDKFGPIKGRKTLHRIIYDLKWKYGLPIPFLFVNKKDD